MSSVNTWPSVGMKCVCIKRGPWTVAYGCLPGGEVFPEYGDVLTIRDVEDGDLRFVEIVNPRVRVGNTETTFSVTRFRPLVTKTQAEDIALFLSIANEVEKPLVNLTDALNLAWELYGVDE